MWVDSHCHLTQLKYTKTDNLKLALQRAKDKGVEGFLCIATDIENTLAVQKISESQPNIWSSAGVHPLNYQPDEDWKKRLIELSSHPDCVAIGETGLDFHYAKEHSEQQWQLQAFEYQIQLSKRLNKPLIIHTRSARRQTLALLKASNLSEKPGVIHCFTEDLAMAEAFVELGFYISFSGIVTFKNAQQIQQAMATIPIERMLIETDSPYLAPVPYRGQSNFPEYVTEIGQFIATQRGIKVEQLASITSNNFYQLFNISR